MKQIADRISAGQGTILKLALAAIVVLFCGILAMVYVVSKQANPVFLDESGKPVDARGGGK